VCFVANESQVVILSILELHKSRCSYACIPCCEDKNLLHNGFYFNVILSSNICMVVDL
jgi:hypothetical protein